MSPVVLQSAQRQNELYVIGIGLANYKQTFDTSNAGCCCKISVSKHTRNCVMQVTYWTEMLRRPTNTATTTLLKGLRLCTPDVHRAPRWSWRGKQRLHGNNVCWNTFWHREVIQSLSDDTSVVADCYECPRLRGETITWAHKATPSSTHKARTDTCCCSLVLPEHRAEYLFI